MEDISPEKWREASIHGIKLAQVIIDKSDRAVDNGRITDPLPLLRDACIKQSNDRIRHYMRATGAVVVELRKTFAAVNEEMKSMNRCKEGLEQALEHKRKDIVLNQESQDLRAYRPLREKVRGLLCKNLCRGMLGKGAGVARQVRHGVPALHVSHSHYFLLS